MKKTNPMVKEVLLVAGGEVIVTVVMFGIFALGGFWEQKVLWGGLIGCALAIIYYALTALGVAIASKRAVEQDEAGGKKVLAASGVLKFALLALVLFMAMRGGHVNPFALVIPIFLFRPILSVCEFFRKSGEKNVS